MMEWLSLSEAAEFLGVHFTTLRRWSNQGAIAYMRTPGGKRKYQRKALEEFLARHHNPVQPENALALLADTAVTITRQDLHASGIVDQAWYHQMGEDQRARMRSSGSRLIALMFQYCAREGNAGVFLEEAKRIAEDYGQFGYQSGLPVTQCIQTFLFFRRPMLNAIHETNALHEMGDIDSQRLFEKLTVFMDELLMAMVLKYQQQSALSPISGR